MTFQPLVRGPLADAAVASVIDADKDIRLALAVVDSLRRTRAANITTARSHGVTLRELATALALTVERIRQMEIVDGQP